MDKLLSCWPVTGPVTVRPQGGGITNRSFLVATPGAQYILRIYGATRDLAKIRFELAVMAGVAAQHPSFAVPTPVASLSGDPIVLTEDGAPATLVPFIRGTNSFRGSLAEARPCGRALGALTQALGRLKVVPPSVDTYWALAASDPGPVLAAAPVGAADRRRLERLLHDVKAAVPALYATLPQQIIHGDYVPSNLLLQDGTVSAVLDFEIAAYDLRALDLAMALAAWGAGLWETGAEWEMLETFCRGYFSQVALTPAELEAIPALIRLRRAVVFRHLTGRYLRGEAPLEVALHGAEGALKLEPWLGRHAGELRERLAEWAARNAPGM